MKNKTENNLMTVVDAQVLQHKQQVENNSLEAEASMLVDRLSSNLAATDPALAAEAAYANQLHGKAVMARGGRQLFRAAEIKIIKEVRDKRLWRHVPVEGSDGSVRLAESFADWCQNGFGCSKTYAYESIKDFEIFGEALDGIRALGIERDHLRLLRKSPEGLIQEVKEAAEKEDKAVLLELIDDIVERHAKEKEELKKEKQGLTDKVQSLEADRQVDQRLLEDKERKINELERELRRDLTPDQASKKRAERDELLKANLLEKSLTSISTLNELAMVVEKIMELDDRDEHLEESLYAELRGVFRHVLLLGRQYDIHPEQLLGLPIPDLGKFDQVLEGELM